MAKLEDILERLTVHAETAVATARAIRLAARAEGEYASNDPSVTKAESFYVGLLGGLDDDQRARVIAWCHNQGIAATFGVTPLGGVNLTLRANAENGNAETPKGVR